MSPSAIPKLAADLTSAANGTNELKPAQMAKLLRRAAAAIQKQRSRSGPVVRSGEDQPFQIDIAFDLLVVANALDLFSPERISAILIEAIDAIMTAD